MKHLLNETYIYEQNVPWIKSVAKKYGKGLEYDDCFNIASIAFIIAVRLYQKKIWRFPCICRNTDKMHIGIGEEKE